MNTEPEASSRPLAVSYLRVSTKEQAERDGDPEGYSIPAQREANLRAAASLNADVIAEFVDRGESARSANRPELKRMLEFVRQEPVSFCIVHKVDRLARNRADDVEINLALNKAGVRLISATENIDETPSGILLHGIMSSIAEFYSRNLANEVIKGISQKARSGGTVARAPLGYRNVRNVDELGREVRSVVVDEDRAPLIKWAFERYARGDTTIRIVAEELEARGLTTLGTPSRPSRPIYTSQLNKMFMNPYYKGEIHYQGAIYEGRHEALVPAGTWQQVQDVMASHVVGEKVRQHHNYLTGSIFCGTCGHRLGVQHSKNRHGVTYEYFVCAGRHEKRSDCKQGAMLIDQVEYLVIEHYRTITLGLKLRQELQRHIEELLASTFDEIKLVRSELENQQRKLQDRQRKLLEAHYANAIPLDLMRSEQTQLNHQLVAVAERLEQTNIRHEDIQSNLLTALDLIENCYDAYRRAPDHVRRQFNQALFTRIEVTQDGQIRTELAQPMAQLLKSVLPHPSKETVISTALRHEIESNEDASKRENKEPCPNYLFGQGSDEVLMVGPAGLEPATRGLKVRCSTN